MLDLPDFVKLVPQFDVKLLQAELFGLGGDRFRPQASFYAGRIVEEEFQGWRVLALRAPGGDIRRADPGGPGLVDYNNTEHMAKTPYTSSILNELGTPLRAVRYLSLEPGAAVAEHRDYPYGLNVGWARLHLPIVTNEQAAITINGVPTCWQPGELWYANFGRLHSLYNHGSSPRVHLVIDCYCGPGLVGLFPSEHRPALDDSELMLRKPEVTLPREHAESLVGDIVIPSAFLKSYLDPPSGETFAVEGEDLTGRVELEQDRLVLRGEDGHESILVHIGGLEFRELCWTEERTLQFSSSAAGARVTFKNRSGSRVVEATRSRCPDSASSSDNSSEDLSALHRLA